MQLARPAALAVTLLYAVHVSQSQAADLRVGVGRAVATVLHEIGGQFEQSTGHRLIVSSDLGPNFVRRIAAGEKFDVLIVGGTQIDELIKAGRLVAATRTPVLRSDIGVGVRAGAQKPDIATVDKFKAALLNAKSIAFLREGASGIYLAGMLERLGIADAVRAKVTRPDTDIVSELVARGEVELGMVVSTQILTTKGVELVGPLPTELQFYVTFTGAISSDSPAPDAAKSLIEFLKGPVALPVIRAQGMDPAP